MSHAKGLAARLSWISLVAILAIGATFTSAQEAEGRPPFGSYAPACRYTTTADTVLDNDTQLTWQRALDPGTYTWSAAAAYCQALTLAGGGWRLPTIQELQTLNDEVWFDPAIDWAAFPGTPNAVFWSSSPDVTDPGFAWRVYTRFGEVDVEAVSTADRVRCVR